MRPAALLLDAALVVVGALVVAAAIEVLGLGDALVVALVIPVASILVVFGVDGAARRLERRRSAPADSHLQHRDELP